MVRASASAGRPRIFNIADDLNVATAQVLEVCKRLGIKAGNQLFAVSDYDRQRIVAAIRGTPLPAPTYRGVERLLSVGAELGIGRLEVVPRVAEIDPECALFKLRKFAERLCGHLIGAPAQDTLDKMIQTIEKQKLLGRKAVTYLTKLRSLGNVAFHDQVDPFDGDFDMDDVDGACHALAVVLSDVAKRGLLPQAITGR